MRRALLLWLLLALAAPAAATAQAQGEAVVGGGSFADAPLLESGTYRDTILPGERLFYGIRLEPGQQLRMRAKLDVKPGEIDQDTAVGFSIGLQTPLREVIVDYDDDIAGNNTVGAADDELEVLYPRVLAASGARSESGNYPGPGRLVPVAVPDLQPAQAGQGRVPRRVRARGRRRPAARRLARADAREGDPGAGARGRGRAAGPRRARSPGSAWPGCWWGSSAAGSPRAATDVDADLVRRLVAAQFPCWAGLPVTPVVPGGHDHRTFRLGFGTSGVGDPACDLVIAWTLLRGRARAAFRDGAGRRRRDVGARARVGAVEGPDHFDDLRRHARGGARRRRERQLRWVGK